jgi:hypothetical protein
MAHLHMGPAKVALVLGLLVQTLFVFALAPRQSSEIDTIRQRRLSLIVANTSNATSISRWCEFCPSLWLLALNFECSQGWRVSARMESGLQTR